MKTINADFFLTKNWLFWKSLENHCMAACCGLKAFEFSEEQILSLVVPFNANKLINELEDFLWFMDHSPLDVVESREVLNCRVLKDDLIPVLKGIKEILLSYLIGKSKIES